MSIKTPHEQRLDAWATTLSIVAESMTEYKWEIAKDFAVSMMLGVLAYQALATGYGAVAGVSVISVGAINTITAADVLEIVRRKKREDLLEASSPESDD